MKTKRIGALFTVLGLLLAAAAMLAVVGIRSSLAVHELGLFELDGNVANDVAAGEDWEDVYLGTGTAHTSVFVQDDNPDGTDLLDEINYLGGGSKDDLDMPNWEWDTSPVPDKDDIMDAGAVIYTSGGDSIIYFFLDRFSSGTGDADVGFWFFKGTHSLVPSDSNPTKGTFGGVHEIGDILVLSEFTIGGGVSTVKVFKWVGDNNGSETSQTPPAPGTGDGPLQLMFTGADCRNADGTPKPGGDLACATVNTANDGVVVPPWPYTDKQNTGDYGLAALFEGGVNVSDLDLDIGCGGTFLANTRASQSTDARLHDFAIGDFSLCDLAVTKDGDTLSKVGDPVDYTITIANTGAVTLYKDDVTDTLFGNLVLNGVNQADPNAWTSFNFATGTPCGASLASGATCTIEVTRTVQAGDPDPLDNTVTVTYNSNNTFTGTALTRSDSHSVKLFVPDISATKTVDGISKVGDSVHYTVTISNDSSSLSLSDAQIPDLVLETADDSIIGELLVSNADGNLKPHVSTFSNGCGVAPATLAETTCTISWDYVIQAGDDAADGATDGVVNNTVSIESHPDGFTNDVDTSASAAVKLFVPDINVTKDCAPTKVAVGDTVHYTCTIQNTSTSLSLTPAEIPALVLETANDSLIGELLVSNATGNAKPNVSNFVNNCGLANIATLAAGASCTISYDKVIQAADDLASDGIADGKVTNTVSVESHPQGFTNDIDDSASCEVTIVGCALSPGFWGGGSGRSKWDQLTANQATSDPIAWAAGFATFSLFDVTKNGDIDVVPSLNPPADTYLEVLGLSASGGDVTKQLAFKYIAARLNQAAFGVPSGVDTLLDDIAAYLEVNHVGSNPGGAAKAQGKALFNDINDYFATVGESFCPLPGEIPEL